MPYGVYAPTGAVEEAFVKIVGSAFITVESRIIPGAELAITSFGTGVFPVAVIMVVYSRYGGFFDIVVCHRMFSLCCIILFNSYFMN